MAFIIPKDLYEIRGLSAHKAGCGASVLTRYRWIGQLLARSKTITELLIQPHPTWNFYYTKLLLPQ